MCAGRYSRQCSGKLHPGGGYNAVKLYASVTASPLRQIPGIPRGQETRGDERKADLF